MSAIARLTAATTKLRGVTRDIVRAEATARGLAARQEIRLQAAVQACVDEPVFREALVATWEAARDVVLEQDAAAGREPASQAVAPPPAPKRLTREQVDRIFDAHQEAPTMQFRYLITEAIVAELQRRQCWQVNSGARCDIQRAPGERRCPDCNPSAAPAPEPSALAVSDERIMQIARGWGLGNARDTALHFAREVLAASPQPEPSAQGEPVACDRDAPVCPWCDRQGWDICQHADDARTCGK